MDFKEAIAKFIMKNEGGDHILVSPFANTNIGKILALNWRKKFFVPQLGEFISPDAFVAWLFSGDESQRWNTRARIPTVRKDQVKLVRNAVYFAKYHQLTALKPILAKECKANEEGKSKIDLPWVEYKIHTSGVKEFHPDQRRTQILKEMVRHLLEKGPKEQFVSELFDYSDTKQQIMEHVKEVFHVSPDQNKEQEQTSEESQKETSEE